METDKRKKPLPGAWLMRGGLPLMAAALFLTGFNLWDESRARRAAERIEARMPRRQRTPPSRRMPGRWRSPTIC